MVGLRSGVGSRNPMWKIQPGRLISGMGYGMGWEFCEFSKLWVNLIGIGPEVVKAELLRIIRIISECSGGCKPGHHTMTVKATKQFIAFKGLQIIKMGQLVTFNLNFKITLSTILSLQLTCLWTRCLLQTHTSTLTTTTRDEFPE